MKFLHLLYDSASWSFKVNFFPIRSDIPITLLCVTVGVGSISRVLVVLQKTNNVVVKCHYFCWIPLLQGGIFDKRSALFVILCQWVS